MVSTVLQEGDVKHRSTSSRDIPPYSPTVGPKNITTKIDLLDSRSTSQYLALLSRNTSWRQIAADAVVRHCPKPRPPLSICLLPHHPLIITIQSLVNAGLNTRALVLIDRIRQGANGSSKPLGSLYLSPEALEILVDTSLDLKASKILPALTRELARTQSTITLNSKQLSYLAPRLSNLYAKLMNACFLMGDSGLVLALYSAATRALVPCDAFMYKRIVQSLFKRFLPFPDTDVRRASRPRKLKSKSGIHTSPVSPSQPPIAAILSQLRLVFNRMAADNIIPSSRMLADVFRGLGSILKLETQGTELEHRKSVSGDLRYDQTEHDVLSPALKNHHPSFRLDRLVLDQEAWSIVGKVAADIFGHAADPNVFQHPGNEGQMLLQMAWADVMLSLREDIADATARFTATKSQINNLSNRINTLLCTNQPWNYQMTFDRLAKSSSLRPHHVNSYGAVESETNPALDLPLGPAPGQWPISRTLTEAQRISLLIRDRLVEGDSIAALLHFHSLASLCGAFRRLCDTQDPEDVQPLLTNTPRGVIFQRPSEMALAEARDELDARMESVYVRLTGHALRMGDSGYVNDVLELAYTLPPRHNKRTFSRVWKRAMGAFVSWRSDWHGSAGIGRAFKTLAQLLGIGSKSSATQVSSAGVIDLPKAKRLGELRPNQELFDLSWLRERQTWPTLGRNVFPRAYTVSALINKAEESTPPHLRPGAKPNRKFSAKHLQDAQRASEEAETRRAIRWLRENHPHYMSRPGDPSPTLVELDAQARAEVHPQQAYDWNSNFLGANRLGSGEEVGGCSGGTPATTMLIEVLDALKVPVATDEARRLGYSGPTYSKKSPQESASSPDLKL